MEIKLPRTAKPEPLFLADNRALDFLNSVSAPSGTEIESLNSGQGLVDWLEKAEMISVEVALYFRKEVSTERLDEVAAKARDLRQWFRKFITAHAGGPLEASANIDLNRINLILKRDESYRQIELRELQALGSPKYKLQWQLERRWRTEEDLLLPVAEVMGDLLCSTDLSQVKICEGPTCALWFHDVSKNHTRRWCSMGVCGNRAKAAAHRSKKREKLKKRTR